MLRLRRRRLHFYNTSTRCGCQVLFHFDCFFLATLWFRFLESFLYFFLVHWLVSLLVHKLYLFIFKHFLKVCLDRFIFECQDDVATELTSKFTCELLSYFLSKFVHDLHVRSFCDSAWHLKWNLFLFPRWWSFVYSFLIFLILNLLLFLVLSNFMLGDVLVKHLVVELERILFRKLIVNSSTMRLNDVWFLSTSILKWVTLSLLSVYKDVLVFKTIVFMVNKSFSWGLVLVISVVKLSHCLIETVTISLFSACLNFFQKNFKFALKCTSSFIETALVSIYFHYSFFLLGSHFTKASRRCWRTNLVVGVWVRFNFKIRWS